MYARPATPGARHLIVIAVALSLALAATACSAGALRPPAGDPSIEGVITQLTPSAEGGALLIESDGDPVYEHDKASVRVDAKTLLLRQETGGTYVRIAFTDLAEGSTVCAWFEGPVAESYPVQAYAGALVVRP